MLFKDYHIELIREGEKTVTRREWDANYSTPNVDSVHIASTEMFESDEDADCYIRIFDVYEQPLGEMTDGDAQREGDYETIEEFREGYERVYGDGAWNPEKTVWVVEFEYAGSYRPSERTGSVWKDCAECASPNTRIGLVDDDCLVVCEDCGAETEGINGWEMAK